LIASSTSKARVASDMFWSPGRRAHPARKDLASNSLRLLDQHVLQFPRAALVVVQRLGCDAIETKGHAREWSRQVRAIPGREGNAVPCRGGGDQDICVCLACNPKHSALDDEARPAGAVHRDNCSISGADLSHESPRASGTAMPRLTDDRYHTESAQNHAQYRAAEARTHHYHQRPPAAGRNMRERDAVHQHSMTSSKYDTRAREQFPPASLVRTIFAPAPNEKLQRRDDQWNQHSPRHPQRNPSAPARSP